MSERALCESCAAEEDREAIEASPPPGGEYQHLGPIQFTTLLESLELVLGSPASEPLAWYAARIRDIARAHAQQIPPDVESYLVRFEASGHGDTA